MWKHSFEFIARESLNFIFSLVSMSPIHSLDHSPIHSSCSLAHRASNKGLSWSSSVQCTLALYEQILVENGMRPEDTKDFSQTFSVEGRQLTISLFVIRQHSEQYSTIDPAKSCGISPDTGDIPQD